MRVQLGLAGLVDDDDDAHDTSVAAGEASGK
jgi:hypothetical protein